MIDLREFSKENPFHNVSRILYKNHGVFPSLPGGDAFQLASLLSFHIQGKIVPCRYIRSKDFHVILQVDPERYIDLTSKHIDHVKGYKNYFKFFKPVDEPLETVFTEYPSELDKTIVCKRWIDGTTHASLNGRLYKVNGVPEIITKNSHLIQILADVFLIPKKIAKFIVASDSISFEPNSNIS